MPRRDCSHTKPTCAESNFSSPTAAMPFAPMATCESHSLSGFLTLKRIGGALALLNSRKRYYFVLDELLSRLLFFKSETEFITKKSSLGVIELRESVITTSDTSGTQFAIHYLGKSYELEAENSESVAIWLKSLQAHQQGFESQCLSMFPGSSISRNTSQASLPSDSEMAAMLDSAFNATSPNKGPENETAVSTVYMELNGHTANQSELHSKWINQWLQHTKSQNHSGQNGNGSYEEPNDTVIPKEQKLSNLTVQQSRYEQRIKQQEQIIRDLGSQLQAQKSNGPDLLIKSLRSQNQFLNAEILRLGKKLQTETEPQAQLHRTVVKLEQSVERYKMEYITLLQSCIRVPLGESSCLVEIKLFGGSKHRNRVFELLQEARQTDPSLPDLLNIEQTGSHVDVYGFQHTFICEGLMLHYCCTQLSQHYLAQQHAQLKERWKLLLKRNDGVISNDKDSRGLIREGIPPAYRSVLWKRIVQQQVAQLQEQLGPHYYKNLTNAANTSENATSQKKQINLDLMRTMPNNIHFNSPNCKGISQMQEVLMAFCQHNPRIGYCQGMNFIVAVGLLFLKPEDTFWLLVAMTEVYFVPNYFDSSLIGAQADQEVLKELLDQKLPDLAEHLRKSDIDLLTITLNWFLAVFFDSLPFETMLRIWDTFLLEGPKVLFRYALAILTLFEAPLLERSDPMSIMKVLKAGAKYTYDADGLTRIAFEQLKPFPKRKVLVRKQTAYIHVLKERFQRKLEVKQQQFNDIEAKSDSRCQPIYLAYTCEASGTTYLVYEQSDHCQLAMVDVHKSFMHTATVEFDCKVIAITSHPEENLLFVSLISGFLSAISTTTFTKLWEVKSRDVALCLEFVGESLFAGLANGCLAIIEKVCETPPNFLDSFYIPLGPAPITKMSVFEDQIWLCMSGRILIFQAKSLDFLEQVYVAGSLNGGPIAIFERVACICQSPYGIWLSTFNSPLIQLWSTKFTCSLVYSIAKDHIRVSHKDLDEPINVSSLLSFNETIWVGTADGYLIVYGITSESPSSRHDRYSEAKKSRKSRYQRKSRELHKKHSSYSDSGFCDSQTRNSHSSLLRSVSQTSSFDEGESKFERPRSLSIYSQQNKEFLPILSPGSSIEKRTPVARRMSKNSNKWSFASLLNASKFRSTVSISECSDKPASLRGCTSMTSMADAYDFDDLFIPYEEDERNNDKNGGLCSSKLARAQSVWSLDGSLSYRGEGANFCIGCDSDTKTLEKSLTVRRKDLDLSQHPDYCHTDKPDAITEGNGYAVESDAASSISISSSMAEPPYPYALSVQMMLKISDKPVKCLARTKTKLGRDVIISCAGSFGEEEAVLRWIQEDGQSLWTNDPVLEEAEISHKITKSLKYKLRLPRSI